VAVIALDLASAAARAEEMDLRRLASRSHDRALVRFTKSRLAISS